MYETELEEEREMRGRILKEIEKADEGLALARLAAANPAHPAHAHAVEWLPRFTKLRADYEQSLVYCDRNIAEYERWQV